MQFQDVSKDTSRHVTRRRYWPRRLVVLHTSMGVDSLSWLQGGSARQGRPASADFLIYRNGDIMQITRPGWHAFHTGQAYWRGLQDPDKTLNQQAVGVELEALEQMGEIVTNEQYIACASLLRRLLLQHLIDADAITTHATIALPPGRKIDPMVFDAQVLFREMVYPSIQAADFDFPEVLP